MSNFSSSPLNGFLIFTSLQIMFWFLYRHLSQMVRSTPNCPWKQNGKVFEKELFLDYLCLQWFATCMYSQITQRISYQEKWHEVSGCGYLFLSNNSLASCWLSIQVWKSSARNLYQKKGKEGNNLSFFFFSYISAQLSRAQSACYWGKTNVRTVAEGKRYSRAEEKEGVLICGGNRGKGLTIVWPVWKAHLSGLFFIRLYELLSLFLGNSFPSRKGQLFEACWLPPSKSQYLR